MKNNRKQKHIQRRNTTYLEIFEVVAQQLEVLVVPNKWILGPIAFDTGGVGVGTATIAACSGPRVVLFWYCGLRLRTSARAPGGARTYSTVVYMDFANELRLLFPKYTPC